MCPSGSSLLSSTLGADGAWLGSSEMAGRVQTFDWSETALGPIETWSQSLTSAVALCLRSPFQMAIYWGHDLICIYNDAERMVLGELHPRALGMPARELLHDSWEVVGPQLAAVTERAESTWAEDRPLRLERRGKVELAYFTYAYSPIMDDDGTVGGVLLVTHETTARVLAQRRMNATRHLAVQSLDATTVRDACTRCARALAQSDDVPLALVYVLDDREGRVTCVAAEAAPDALPVSPPGVALADAANEVSSLLAELVTADAGGRLVPLSLVMPAVANGRGAPEMAFVAPLASGSADRLEGVLVAGVRDDLVFDRSYAAFLELAAMSVGRSIAAARNREAEQRRAAEIAKLDRGRSALFGNASHELRTPLALVIGHLEELLADPRLDPSLVEVVKVARRSSQRMLRLVNALLDFSRIEGGQSVGSARLVDAGRLTADIAAMFESAAQRAGLRLISDCPPARGWACVDPEAWERIVSNLISNAVKFTPSGEIRVRTWTDGEELCLSVQDTGIGIAGDDLDRIFRRFYRSAASGVSIPEGSGIGLALVRELVDLHQGTIKVSSRPGRGTLMTVRVPRARERCGEDPSDAGVHLNGRGSSALLASEAEGWFDPPGPRSESGQAGGQDHVDGGTVRDRPRLLVVEDNADMGDYLRRLLTPEFSVQLARDGTEALGLVDGNPPSLVISDVMMPDTDGFALIRELRSTPRTRCVPVILLSARADAESSQHALDLGADDYITKPFVANELRARIRATLENTRRRTDAAAAQARVQERGRHEGELRALLNDLRAAQRRVVAAGDAERRRIERDLHDGAQQRLMAVRLELGLLEEQLQEETHAAVRQLAPLRRELDEALEELRELAHGLYPPLLASDGLEAALTAVGRRSPLPVRVDAPGLTRAPRAIESTAYFCCIEALQNAAKHAGPGAHVTIKLAMKDHCLAFSVEDDGMGFDPDVVRPGQGLVNLRDRLSGLGGSAEIRSAPGAGTSLAGQIPLS